MRLVTVVENEHDTFFSRYMADAGKFAEEKNIPCMMFHGVYKNNCVMIDIHHNSTLAFKKQVLEVLQRSIKDDEAKAALLN